MNPQDPLAALHPLREPPMIGWWPLAPGWWVVIALAVLAVALLAYYLRRHYRANAYRRQALRQLRDLHTDINQLTEETLRGRKAATEINSLLKAVALRVFPRHDIAALSGEAWLEFLNKTGHSKSGDTAFPPNFANAAYQKDSSTLDAEQLFQASRNWISRHRAVT